jgi:hypothetical protein
MTAQTRLTSVSPYNQHTSINGEASNESVLLISTPKFDTNLATSAFDFGLLVRLNGF